MATIQKRGDGWRVQIRRKGRKAISRTFRVKREAERWADHVEGQIAARGFVDQPEIRLTLREALIRYLAEVTPGKKGAEQERFRIGTWLRHPLSHHPLTIIQTSDLARWRNDREAEGQAPSSIRNSLSVISQVFKVSASEWGMERLHNPVVGLRMPRNRLPRDRRLEVGEEESLMKACHPGFQTMVAWALETAMRRGEILGLQPGDIRGRVAYLRETKNGKPRAVPLSSKALLLTEAIPFPFSPDQVRRRWIAVCRKAGIADLHFHDLRHEATSRLFEKGPF